MEADSDSNYSSNMTTPPSDIPTSNRVASPPRDLAVPRFVGRADKRPLVDGSKKFRRDLPNIFGTIPASM